MPIQSERVKIKVEKSAMLAVALCIMVTVHACVTCGEPLISVVVAL